MKILYDHQIFTWQKYGGISRYFYEIIRGIDGIQDISYEVPLFVSNNHYISDKKYIKYVDLLSNIHFKGKNRMFKLLNKTNTIFKLKHHNFDIFHPTYYDPYFLKYLNNKPFVLTVHDMIHEKFSEMFSPFDKTTKQKRLLVEKAAKIIAVSQNTKKDLMEIFGIDGTKIEVVYHGNSMFPQLNIPFGYELPQKYLLFVGNRFIYKNFNRFITSMAELLKKDRELFVVCVGGGKFTNNEIEQFKELGISKQVLQYNVNDDVIANFYKNAIAFIFPSLYEGFGIPLLEAFACGCPVVCSNGSSLPEVADDAAYYFDPYNEESIKDAVLRILNDKDLRQELIAKGQRRLKQFSWQRTVEETIKIYKSVLA